jgi:hypothetical protein
MVFYGMLQIVVMAALLLFTLKVFSTIMLVFNKVLSKESLFEKCILWDSSNSTTLNQIEKEVSLLCKVSSLDGT